MSCGHENILLSSRLIEGVTTINLTFLIIIFVIWMIFNKKKFRARKSSIILYIVELRARKYFIVFEVDWRCHVYKLNIFNNNIRHLNDFRQKNFRARHSSITLYIVEPRARKYFIVFEVDWRCHVYKLNIFNNYIRHLNDFQQKKNFVPASHL